MLTLTQGTREVLEPTCMRQMGQVYTATPISVGRVRRAVSEFAGDVGGDSETVGEIALAVGEACPNVVVHATAMPSRPGRW